MNPPVFPVPFDQKRPRTWLCLWLLLGCGLILTACRIPPRAARRSAFDPVLLVQKPVSSLPLINAGNRQWWVRAELDGREGLFALDTGSANTLITPQFAALLVTAGSENKSARAKSGFTNVTYLRLGGILYLDFYAPIVNLDHINRAMHAHLDGILGMNILGKTTCTLDWRHDLLVIDSGFTPPPPQAIPLTWRNSRLYAPASLNGQPIPFTLDTGAYRSCLGPAELARAHIPPAKQTRIEAPRIDIVESRELKQTQVLLDTFALGPIYQTNYEMLTWSHSVLGMDLLEPWLLTFDARGPWMTLTRPSP